mgnify:CR=1 FL=1
MKAKSVRNYKKSTGTTVFVYELTGTTEELARYAEIQGEFHIIDEKSKKPLYFTTRYVGENVNVLFNQAGDKVFPDTSEMDKVKSLAEQHGADFGALLVQSQLQSMFASKPAVTAEAPVEEPADDDLNDI